MEEKIVHIAKLIANSDISGVADLTWHKICVEMLENGLNTKTLEEFSMEDGTHTLGEMRDGEIHMMASYLMNFLSIDAFNISYCAEISSFVKDFVEHYK